MYYSENIIEEVRSRNDIVDVIGSYVTLKKRGNSYMACCPFHHEKTPSFHVNRDKQMYHCFGCGAGGNVLTFVMEYENYSFPEAVKMLAERAGITLPEQSYSKEQRQQENYKTVLKEMNRLTAIYYNYLLTQTKAGEHALEYYHDRGFSDDTIRRFGLGYASPYSNDLYQYLKKQGYTDAQLKDSGLVRFDERRGGQDMFWNRAMVPILDINSKVVGFGGRVLGDGTPKYINTKETAVFDKSHTLFAMNIARRSKRRGIILCEGYMDVIAMHQAGFDNAAASLGTALTMGHATIVKRYTDEVYLAYDSDGAGRNATMKAISIMREVGIATRVIDLRPYKDPDEFIHNLGKEAFEERIACAMTGIIFEIDSIAASYNLGDPEEKIRFVKEAARRLAQLDEPVVRHSYTEAVAEKYRLNPQDLKEIVTKYGTIGLTDSTKRYDDNTNFPPGIEQRQNRSASQTAESDAQTQPQRLLLTWMVGDTRLFKILEGIITEDDFIDPDYYTVAKRLFDQYRDTGNVNPAAIVNLFEDVEKQRLAAKILQTELDFAISEDEKEAVINELIRKVKMVRIDHELANIAANPEKLPAIIAEKGKLAKMHISLKNG